MFSPLSLLLSIFVTYPKDNDLFIFFNKNLGMPGVRMQKYLKSTSTKKVSGMGTALFLEYLCFIDLNYKTLNILTYFSHTHFSL